MHLPPDLNKLTRGAAVVLPKDFGAVVAFTGLSSSSTVAEAGAGTGFMTAQLARIARKVYSYENREEHFRIAKANVERLGLENVELVNKSIEELGHNDLDVIFLDFKDSDELIEKMHAHLKSGGWLVGYCPNIEQAKAFHLKCNSLFSEVFTLTSHTITYSIRDFGCRPDNFSLTHTAYLVFARR